MSETLSDDDIDTLERVLASADSERLNDWERSFLASLDDRFQKYRERTSMSQKQLEIVERIEQKLEE